MRYKVKVIPGSGRGRKIGVPTINFVVPKSLSLGHGIYAGWLIVNNRKYPAAIHFGPRPVFGEEKITLEAHLIGDFLPQFRLKEAEIEFVSYIRKVMDFPTVEAMVERIDKDIKNIIVAMNL